MCVMKSYSPSDFSIAHNPGAGESKLFYGLLYKGCSAGWMEGTFDPSSRSAFLENLEIECQFRDCGVGGYFIRAGFSLLESGGFESVRFGTTYDSAPMWRHLAEKHASLFTKLEDGTYQVRLSGWSAQVKDVV